MPKASPEGKGLCRDIRQPIVVTVGHIDHGKTSILDRIRGTAIQSGEAGGITQSIGASIIPIDTIRRMCGPLLEKAKVELTIPGLLFIDTPGHEAFTSLRKRGGSIADIAILVVDINEGLMPQTREAVAILKQYRTPFLVAANKIDLIPGWQPGSGFLMEVINAQAESVQYEFEKRFYELVEQLKAEGFDADRFDRAKDYTKQVCVVPCSAKAGVGVPELVMVLAGLTQRFLNEGLRRSLGPGKGAILEVKETKGHGTTIDVILHDGELRREDTIVVGTLAEPIVTKIRALFEPKPLAEMRDKKSPFCTVDCVSAATGVKISAPGLEKAVSGMPVIACSPEDAPKIAEEVRREIQGVLIETGKKGVVIKADSIGSLEALQWMLNQKKIGIRRASIGVITRKDLMEAEANIEEDERAAVILGFNVEVDPQIEDLVPASGVKIFLERIIYRLIDAYEKWILDFKKAEAARKLQGARPCKIHLLPGYVFRQSNPAIVGVEVLAGELRTGAALMKEERPGEAITTVKAIQMENKNISAAPAGKRVAVSLDKVIIGRQLNEGDELYSSLTEAEFRQFKQGKEFLSPGDVDLLREIAALMRKSNPVWGV